MVWGAPWINSGHALLPQNPLKPPSLISQAYPDYFLPAFPLVAPLLPERDSTPEPSVVPQGLGVRWLAGNGADTALDSLQREGRGESGVCPHPSPTALQDTGAPAEAGAGSRTHGAKTSILRPTSIQARGSGGVRLTRQRQGVSGPLQKARRARRPTSGQRWGSKYGAFQRLPRWSDPRSNAA